jgi:hypothetical protein
VDTLTSNICRRRAHRLGGCIGRGVHSEEGPGSEQAGAASRPGQRVLDSEQAGEGRSVLCWINGEK